MRVRHAVYTFGLLVAAFGAFNEALAQAVGQGAPANDGSQIGEIIVTAQRRSERLQDVPMTVEALSQTQLQTAGVENLQDLKLLVPGLQVANSIGFATTHLRGVGSTAIGPGVENPIAVYVDGVYYASTSSAMFDFLNVQDVQVLKGPQGTLFGRNATGGLIQVTTREPTQQTRFDATLSYGNFNTVKGGLYLSGGFAANLAADVAIQLGHSGQGYGTNFYNNEDVGKNDISENIRSKWVWTPLDSTKVTASFDFSHQRNSFLALRIPFGQPNLPALVTQPAPAGSAWDVNADVQPLYENKNGGASVRVDQDFSVFHLMDIVAYRQANSHVDFDLDLTPEPFEGAFLQTDEDQISEEIQLSSLGSSSVRWVGGFYYFKSNSKYDPSHVEFDPNPALSPGFQALSVYGNQGARSLAPYGQASFTVLPATELTVGARFTSERHTLFGHEPIYLADGSTLVNTAFAGTSRNFDKFTYRVALDHRFTDEIKMYGSYSTGFKSGGFNTQTLGDPPYQPETLEASEIGVKAELFDRTVRLDLSGFHYLYSEIQVQKVEAATTGIINGASATINGVDLDTEYRAAEHLTFNASAEYLLTRFGSFANAPIGPPYGESGAVTTGSADGNTLPFASRFAYTLAGNYEFKLPSGPLTLNATANRVGIYPTEADNIIKQKAYTKFNASLRWASMDERYALMLWGKNLSNVASLEYEATLENGLRNANYAAPRTYGITFEYHIR